MKQDGHFQDMIVLGEEGAKNEKQKNTGANIDEQNHASFEERSDGVCVIHDTDLQTKTMPLLEHNQFLRVEDDGGDGILAAAYPEKPSTSSDRNS